MTPKEQGLVLSIDQASNAAGVSLWQNGELLATMVLKAAKATDPMSARLRQQVEQLTVFLSKHVGDGGMITKILFEGVRARLVMTTVGAFLTCPLINAKVHPTASFVESFAWKKYARDRGATEASFKDIKGVKALRDIGFDVDGFGIESDDEADSVLIYLTWASKQ